MKPEEQENYKKAGKIISQARSFAKDYAQEGMKLIDIAEAVENKIRELGAEPAFPVNTSLNGIAAHHTPKPGSNEVATGLLKIDLGAHVNGYIADTAVTVDLTKNEEFKEQCEINQELLQAGKKIITPKVEVGEIGTEISKKLSQVNEEHKVNYTIIAGLTGHGLAKDTIHTSPNIPNYPNNNSAKLTGKAFAVEPFVTTGTGEIIEGEGGGIYMLTSNSQVRDRDARTVLQHIITHYQTRPFCERWLIKDGLTRTRYALSILEKQDIIHQFPLLIERTRAPVSQFEHTFVVTEDEAICITEN